MGEGKIERLGFEPGFKDASIFNSPLAAWSATNGGKFASDDGQQAALRQPPGHGRRLECMQRAVQQIGGREALDDYVSRNRAANDSFTNGLRSMFLTNHSFPARLKAVAPDLRYGIGTAAQGQRPAAPRASSAGAGPTASPPASRRPTRPGC